MSELYALFGRPREGGCRSIASMGLILMLGMGLFLAACAQKSTCIDNALSGALTLSDARYRFGPPKNSTPQPDGTTVHEWSLDVDYVQPGRFETETSPWVRHDSDGYRIETEREVWKRPRQISKFCRLIIRADAAGRVLSSEYEGADCCDLVMRPAPAAR